MTEAYFDGLLLEIIDQHRRAQRRRLRMRQAFAFLSLTAVALYLVSFANAAPPQAYPGCKFAWDYPASEMSRVTGFFFVLDNPADRANYVNVEPPALEIPCASFDLSPGEHTLYAWVWNEATDKESAKASLTFIYSENPPSILPMPTNLRVIMEWQAE
jgi:hypothetical protein